MLITDKNIEDYILSHSDREDALLAELSRETNVKIYHPRRLSGHMIGLSIGMFCRMIKPGRVLEIGTFTGYASICIARNIGEGSILYTIEINDELTGFAGRFFEKAGVSGKIRLIIGDALKIIPSIDEMFDLVYIDGNKKEYPDYYHAVFDKLLPGGYIIADNVLWDGKVLTSEPESGDHFTRGIKAFNDLVANDDRVEKLIIPVGDGLMVIRKLY
ncbi:MAG: O-methyltransferase [Bacteroidia bacterium]|nr:O-methyltransferase [Bacteroidia bacterium]